MPGIKELKTKIRSVHSTRKITRAMQMVSAAKMRKVQNAVVSSRAYSTLAEEMIQNLSSQISFKHPLLTPHPKAKKIAVVILASNRGLVGSLNTNIGVKIKEISEQNQGLTEELIIYGKKAKILAQKTKKNILADFEKKEKTLSVEDIYSLAKYLTDLYETGEYKKIIIAYNFFVSTLQQKPSVKQLLPLNEGFTPEEDSEEENEDNWDKKDKAEKNGNSKYFLGNLGSEFTELKEKFGDDDDFSPYIYEPTPQTIFDHLIPRIVESQIYQTILESNASEHSARMVMMKNATESADELISDYTLTYNQLRQNKITTELAEITAGRIALE